jgi:hypothetical protein
MSKNYDKSDEITWTRVKEAIKMAKNYSPNDKVSGSDRARICYVYGIGQTKFYQIYASNSFDNYKERVHAESKRKALRNKFVTVVYSNDFRKLTKNRNQWSPRKTSRVAVILEICAIIIVAIIVIVLLKILGVTKGV